MTNPHLLGTTKNKEGGLDNHKGFRDNQELGMNHNIHLLNKTTPLRLWEVALSNAQKSQSRKMKNQVTCFKQNKIKEQNKKTETEVKEMEIVIYLLKSSK